MRMTIRQTVMTQEARVSYRYKTRGEREWGGRVGGGGVKKIYEILRGNF